MPKPNLFIVGAPKCGTTSLWSWLAEHPNIFMSRTKEPNFFNTDNRQAVTTLDQYEEMFRNAGKVHFAIGEATPLYLSSSQAIGNILNYSPSARFIVMIRNPVEMAPALHGQSLLGGIEWIEEFSEAWNLQKERRKGRNLRIRETQPLLLYGDMCLLGAQVQRLRSIVPSERILVIILDDLRTSPRREYLRVMDFLGVRDDNRLRFPVANEGASARWPSLMPMLRHLKVTKDRLGLNIHTGIWDRAERLNRIAKPRNPLPEDMKRILIEYFRSDIELLGSLLERDLRSWLT